MRLSFFFYILSFCLKNSYKHTLFFAWWQVSASMPVLVARQFNQLSFLFLNGNFFGKMWLLFILYP